MGGMGLWRRSGSVVNRLSGSFAWPISVAAGHIEAWLLSSVVARLQCHELAHVAHQFGYAEDHGLGVPRLHVLAVQVQYTLALGSMGPANIAGQRERLVKLASKQP